MVCRIFAAIRCLAARREPDIEIDIELSQGSTEPYRYGIGLTQQVRGYRQPILRYERVWIGNRLILNRPDSYDKDDDLRLTQTHLEQISANSSFREVSRFLESIRYLHLVPQLLRYPEAYQGGSSVQDDPYGRNFLDVVAKTPDKTRRSRLQRIESALREAVPQLAKLTGTKDETGMPHLEVLYEHWQPNAGRQREDQFSDGMLRLIGLFWALLDGDSPLLLEEPELSLNSGIVKQLPALFSRLQRRRNRELFVSTHSWDLLSEKGIGGEEVLLLTPGPEGTDVRLASTVEDVRELLDAGASIADAALPRTRPANRGQLDLSL